MQNTNTHNEMAASCARHLARMFGSAEDAAKALEQDPVAMVAIAVDAHMETMRTLTNAALTRRGFSEQVLGMVQDKQQRR